MPVLTFSSNVLSKLSTVTTKGVIKLSSVVNIVCLFQCCVYRILYFTVSFPVILWITSLYKRLHTFMSFFICLFIHGSLLREIFTLCGTWSRTTLLIAYLNSCQSWLTELDWGSLCKKLFPKLMRSFFIDWRSPLWYRATLCWLVLDVTLQDQNIIVSWSEMPNTMSRLLIFGWEEKTKSNILSWHVGKYIRIAQDWHH